MALLVPAHGPGRQDSFSVSLYSFLIFLMDWCGGAEEREDREARRRAQLEKLQLAQAIIRCGAVRLSEAMRAYQEYVQEEEDEEQEEGRAHQGNSGSSSFSHGCRTPSTAAGGRETMAGKTLLWRPCATTRPRRWVTPPLRWHRRAEEKEVKEQEEEEVEEWRVAAGGGAGPHPKRCGTGSGTARSTTS